jgi:hypothetical protein
LEEVEAVGAVAVEGIRLVGSEEEGEVKYICIYIIITFYILS